MPTTQMITTAEWKSALSADIAGYEADASLTGLTSVPTYGCPAGMSGFELREEILGWKQIADYTFLFGDVPSIGYMGNESGHGQERTLTDHILFTRGALAIDASAADQVWWYQQPAPESSSGRFFTSQMPGRVNDPKNPRTPLQIARDYLAKLHDHETRASADFEQRVAMVDHFDYANYSFIGEDARRELGFLASALDYHPWPVQDNDGFWDAEKAGNRSSRLMVICAGGWVFQPNKGWFYYTGLADRWLADEPKTRLVFVEGSFANDYWEADSPLPFILAGPHAVGGLHLGYESVGVHLLASPGSRLGDVGRFSASATFDSNSPLEQRVIGEPRILFMDAVSVQMQSVLDRVAGIETRESATESRLTAVEGKVRASDGSANLLADGQFLSVGLDTGQNWNGVTLLPAGAWTGNAFRLAPGSVAQNGFPAGGSATLELQDKQWPNQSVPHQFAEQTISGLKPGTTLTLTLQHASRDGKQAKCSVEWDGHSVGMVATDTTSAQGYDVDSISIPVTQASHKLTLRNVQGYFHCANVTLKAA